MPRTVLILLSLAAIGLAQTTIDADNANIRYTGRVDFTSAKRPRFDWAGVQVSARFTGTSLGILLDWTGTHVNVYVDGDSVMRLSNGSGLQTVTVAQGLTDSEHDVLVMKRNEFGTVTFGGFVLDNGKTLVPLGPRPPRRIEFIGDSYAVCYGCESRVTSCTDVRAMTNAWYSFGAVTARNVGAEYSIVAFGGRGLLHNPGNSSVVSPGNMQELFSRIRTGSATPVWDSAGWVPQVVVVGLGINDVRDAAVPVSQEVFTQHYRAFIARLQGCYPGTSVLCLAFDWPDTLESYVRTVYEAERAAGNTKVHFLHVAGYNVGGCDFHPNVGGQFSIAQQVTPVIQGILGATPVQAPPAAGRPSAPGQTRMVVTGAPDLTGPALYDLKGRLVRADRLPRPDVAVRVIR